MTMNESFCQYPDPEYNWQEPNPSTEIAFPILLSVVFDGECAWMAERSYENEEKFELTEQLYRTSYPNLFEEVEALSAANAQVGSFEDSDFTMKHYYRGAVIAIRALEASIGEESVQDLTADYLQKVTTLDMIDLESWLLTMRVFTSKHTQQMRGFIKGDYDWLNEPAYAKTAMLVGAQYIYILLAHSRACVEREKELAWELYQKTTADQAYEVFVRAEEETQYHYLE